MAAESSGTHFEVYINSCLLYVLLVYNFFLLLSQRKATGRPCSFIAPISLYGRRHPCNVPMKAFCDLDACCTFAAYQRRSLI